jgi:hypothetical protein
MTIPTQDRKQMLIGFLKDYKVQVTFTKVNGEKRVMNCTLKEDLIPIALDNTVYQAKPKSVNPNTIAVYDLDKNDWRSFRIDSITETKLL